MKYVKRVSNVTNIIWWQLIISLICFSVLQEKKYTKNKCLTGRISIIRNELGLHGNKEIF